ncbi:MAG: HAD-IA family hydrolase [Thermodesulfobacteriota bacterium]
MMPFDLTIFDYDGVLVDSLEEVIKASREVCRSMGHGCMLTREIVSTLEPMTYTQLARTIGLPPDRLEPFSEFVFTRLQQQNTAMPFYPGIESLLRELAAPNIAIISGNSREVISAKLAAHALDKQVASIFGAYEPGDKTDKIGRACAQFGADPARTCMIGDSVSDIQYAKKAGVQSIAVTWGWQSRDALEGEKPDYIVEEVSELAALLKPTTAG